jgi:hypothetical protein
MNADEHRFGGRAATPVANSFQPRNTRITRKFGQEWWPSAWTLQIRRFDGKTTAMSAPKVDLFRAIELALAGDWDAAHQVVQQYEDDATAAWIHALLHKMEGDLGNARYWYLRADRMDRVADEPRAELTAIQAELRQ